VVLPSNFGINFLGGLLFTVRAAMLARERTWIANHQDISPYQAGRAG
jgi:hypothetical protein